MSMPRPPSPRSLSASARLSAATIASARHRVHHVHAAARQQRRIELERRIFGRRANEHDDAFLDVRQERILLHLVEAVHLVDEEHACGCPAQNPPRLRRAPRARPEGRSALPISRGISRRRTSRAAARASSCRSPADPTGSSNARGRSRSRGATAFRAEQALLADDLVERARPHAFGERLQRFGLGEQRCGGRDGGLRRGIGASYASALARSHMSSVEYRVADAADAGGDRGYLCAVRARHDHLVRNRSAGRRSRSRSACARIGRQYPWLVASSGGQVDRTTHTRARTARGSPIAGASMRPSISIRRRSARDRARPLRASLRAAARAGLCQCVRRNIAAERGERRSARGDGLHLDRRLPKRRLQARRVARCRLVAARVAGAAGEPDGADRIRAMSMRTVVAAILAGAA